MKRIAFLLLLAACSGTPLDTTSDDLTQSIGPQSFTHATLSGSSSTRSFTFHGQAGDIVAPDVWPTASKALTPTLTLVGPGHATLAQGAPRGQDAGHLAIDGFHLPQTGTYTLKIGVARGSAGGMVTLRLWMQSSHLPRQEGSQIDLSPRPSAAASAALQSHQQQPRAWSDAEVDGLIADALEQNETRVAFSSAQALLSALTNQEATDAQRSRAASAAAQVVGTQRHFRAIDPSVQSFALWSLDGLLFRAVAQTPPPAVDETIAQLIAAWPGAHEDRTRRVAVAEVLNGVVYGWQVQWSAAQTDLDGNQLWVDSGREWFDSSGHWLGEQSAGASEPDDD